MRKKQTDFPTSDRRDQWGRIRFMARASGYVMVRRPVARPYVLREKEWLQLSEYDNSALATRALDGPQEDAK